jgi:hypothetical protein
MRQWQVSLLCALATCPVFAAAQQPSCEELRAILDDIAPASEAVKLTMASGLTLSEAAVYTLVCGGEIHRVEVATDSVMMAGSLAQAQSVAAALTRTAGESGPVAVAVDQALREYARSVPQPGVHQDAYSPHGGGVSPSS